MTKVHEIKSQDSQVSCALSLFPVKENRGWTEREEKPVECSLNQQEEIPQEDKVICEG